MVRFWAILWSVVLAIVMAFNIAIATTPQTEILWDSWGVPHIYGSDAQRLFQGLGWAQAKSHGNLILRLYGQARGKAAEYWGIDYLTSDQYVATMGIPERAKQWYDAQSPKIKQYLAAFAQGINEYAAKHQTEIDEAVKVVLPVTGADVLAHYQRVIHFHFLTNPKQIAALQNTSLGEGSNGWAISGTKSANGKAILLANPHLPWSDFYLWYEAHLNAPGMDVYGATLVGMPVLAIAFNQNLGWTVTVNPLDGADIYELTLQAGGYVWDQQIKSFESQTKRLKIRQSDGKFIELAFSVQQSIHGPIVAQDSDRAYALRVAGLDRPRGFEQFWQMAQAKNLSEFETALKQLQIPLFNILYSDRQGQNFYIYNGLVPLRSTGDWQYWRGKIPGDTAATLWQDYLPYDKLPRLLNPPTGWLQNSNDPPWTSTFPPVLKAEDYPPYLAPPSLAYASDILRSQRSIKLLKDAEKLTLEDVIEKKFSSRLEMADRILEILIPTAKALANPIGIEAAEVLAKWDRQTNTNSRGAVLFYLWALTLESKEIFSKPWDAANPLTTPSGLADINTALAVLEGVAAQVNLLYGTLDVPWGEVVKLSYGKETLAASGGPGKLGSFRVLNLESTPDERFKAVFGDSFIAAVEFSNPIQAKVLTVYGNATQPNSSHVGDQLSLYAKGEMRSAWLTREEVEQHLELKEVL